MPIHLTSAREGKGFAIGNTHVYVGPGVRGTKAPAVLAYTRVGDTKPTVVGDFRNATGAAAFIAALTQGIDEGTARKPIPFENAEDIAAGQAMLDEARVRLGLTPPKRPRAPRTPRATPGTEAAAEAIIGVDELIAVGTDEVTS